MNEIIKEYIEEMVHWEHDQSTQILARLLLLCELLVERGILNDIDIMKKLSDVNVARMLEELNYGDDEFYDKVEL